MNVTKLLRGFLLLILAAGLTSCDKDDDKVGNANMLIGTWELLSADFSITHNGETVDFRDANSNGLGTFTFKPNGELIVVDYEDGYTPVQASYVYDKGKLTILSNDWSMSYSTTYDITELTSQRLVLGGTSRYYDEINGGLVVSTGKLTFRKF